MPEPAIAVRLWYATTELIGSGMGSSCPSIHGKDFGRLWKTQSMHLVPGRYWEWPPQEGRAAWPDQTTR